MPLMPARQALTAPVLIVRLSVLQSIGPRYTSVCDHAERRFWCAGLGRWHLHAPIDWLFQRKILSLLTTPQRRGQCGTIRFKADMGVRIKDGANFSDEMGHLGVPCPLPLPYSAAPLPSNPSTPERH